MKWLWAILIAGVLLWLCLCLRDTFRAWLDERTWLQAKQAMQQMLKECDGKVGPEEQACIDRIKDILGPAGWLDEDK